MYFWIRPLDDTDYLGDISLDDQEISNDDDHDQKLFENNGKLESRKTRSKSAKSSRGKENKISGEHKSGNETKASAKKSKFSKRAFSERFNFIVNFM